MSHERRLLGDLALWCGRAIHLQCSHGLDALSLWKLGAREVIGVDISEFMLALAGRKARLLAAPATWVHSNVLDSPGRAERHGRSGLHGKGCVAVMDLERWAAIIERLLKPSGRLFVFEGHPLNWVWEPEASELRLRADGGDYFGAEPRANRDFPASSLEQEVAIESPAPCALERQWTLGEVVTRLAEVGLILGRLEEHPEQYWPLFRKTRRPWSNDCRIRFHSACARRSRTSGCTGARAAEAWSTP